MSNPENNSNPSNASNASNATEHDLEVDVDAVVSRLDKHMQRLPWKASKLQPLPSELVDFVVNWLVPILNDLYLATTASLTMHEENNNFVAGIYNMSQQALTSVQATLQGESVALLHLQFKRLHSVMVDKLSPTDPASFALMEMHDVFVRLGLEDPFDAEDAENAENAEPEPTSDPT